MAPFIAFCLVIASAQAEEAGGVASLTKEECEELDAGGYNALHRAAAAGAEQAVRTILEKGVDIGIRSDAGGDDPKATALALAAGKSHEGVVHLLLEHHAEPDEVGMTSPLLMAASSGAVGIVRQLLDAGATVDAPGELGDRTGVTALAAAAMTGQADVVDVLLQVGADPTAKDSLGMSVLQLATAYSAQAAAHPQLRATIEEAGGGQHKRVLTALRRALAAKGRARAKQEV